MRAPLAAVLWLAIVTLALVAWFQPEPDPACIRELDELNVVTIATCVHIDQEDTT